MGTAVVAPVLPGVSIVNDTLGLGRARRLSRRLEAYESFLPAEVACSTVMAAMELVAAGAGHVITKLDRGGGKTQYLNTQLNLVVRTQQSFGMRDIKLPGGTVVMPHQLHPPCLLYSLHLPYLHLPTPTYTYHATPTTPTHTYIYARRGQPLWRGVGPRRRIRHLHCGVRTHGARVRAGAYEELRGRQANPADSSGALLVNYSALPGCQALVGTALKRAEAGLSNGVSTSARKQESGE